MDTLRAALADGDLTGTRAALKGLNDSEALQAFTAAYEQRAHERPTKRPIADS